MHLETHLPLVVNFYKYYGATHLEQSSSMLAFFTNMMVRCTQEALNGYCLATNISLSTQTFIK